MITYFFAIASLYYLFILSTYVAAKTIYKNQKTYSPFEGKVSVILPIAEIEASFDIALTSLLKDLPDSDNIQVVVVTSEKKEEFEKYVKEKGFEDRIEIVYEISRIGKGNALNLALKKCTGEIIVIYDSDNETSAASLKHLITPFSDNSVDATVGAIYPKNVQKNDVTRTIALEYVWYYGGLFFSRKTLNLFVPLPGRNFAIRRKHIDAVGGFSDSALAEDLNMTRKIYSIMNPKVIYISEAKIYEEIPDNITALQIQRTRWGTGAITEYLAPFTEEVPKSNPLKKMFDVFFMGLEVSAPYVAMIAFLLMPILFTKWQAYALVSVIMLYLIFAYEFRYPLSLILYLPFVALLDFYMSLYVPAKYFVSILFGKKTPGWVRTPKNQ